MSNPENVSDPATVTDEQNNIEVYKAVSPGVVYIQSTTMVRDFFGFAEEREGAGSGSVIDEQGHILTNYHVIEGASELSVHFGSGRNYPATVVGRDPDTDLAVIKLVEKPKEAITVVPLGDSDKLIKDELGEQARVELGAPDGEPRIAEPAACVGDPFVNAADGRPFPRFLAQDTTVASFSFSDW